MPLVGGAGFGEWLEEDESDKTRGGPKLPSDAPYRKTVVAFILIRWVEFARIEIQVVTPGRRAHSTGPQVAIGTVIV